MKTVLIKYSLIVAALMSAGCTTTQQAVPTGHGTYLVASHGVMGHSSGPEQKVRAFERANAFCKKSGQEVQALNQAETQSSWGVVPSAEIEFRCVTEGTVK